MLRLRGLKNHVVICGLGNKGASLAEGFIRQGWSVVGVDLDGDSSHVALCRSLGVIILIGNATDTGILRRAGVARAKYLFALCGDDGVNALIGAHARSLSRGRKRGALMAYINVIEPELTDQLRGQELSARSDDRFRLEFFNLYERGAHALLSQWPPCAVGSNRCNVIVAGMDQLGSCLLLALARAWNTRLRHQGKTIRLVLVGESVESAWRDLSGIYPVLASLPDVVFVSSESDIAALLEGKDGSGLCEHAGIAYVCHENESSALTHAFRIEASSAGADLDIVACTRMETGLGRQFERDGGENNASGIESFGLVENTCTPGLLLGVSFHPYRATVFSP